MRAGAGDGRTGGDMHADSRSYDGAEVRTQAIQMLEVFGAASVGEAEREKSLPSLLDFTRATTKSQREVLGIVGCHV